jgi:magnesium chelatase family protein
LQKISGSSTNMIRNYQQKISGPLLDRIDIYIDVPRVDNEKLADERRGEPSKEVRAHVEDARNLQRQRFAEDSYRHANTDMEPSQIRDFCKITREAEQLINATLRQMQLSARSYHRILELARTIADLAEHEIIQINDMAEAIQYRPRRLGLS